MNALAASVSLMGYLAWLHFSPHASSERAAILDRLCERASPLPVPHLFFKLCLVGCPNNAFRQMVTGYFCFDAHRHEPFVSLLSCAVGCYYVVQLLGNFLVMGSGLWVCSGNARMAVILVYFNLLFTHGVSILGTNLLAHRYMYEKARTMATM